MSTMVAASGAFSDAGLTALLSGAILVCVPLLFAALVWGGAWVVGDRVRQRRARVAGLEEQLRRAEQEADQHHRDLDPGAHQAQ